MADEIGLQELISRVKQELLTPHPDDPVPLFYVEEVTLELTVEVRKEAQAGIKIYVVDVSGGGNRQTGQTVRVCLRPLYTVDEMRKIAEQDPNIGPKLADAAAEGLIKKVFQE